jgi:hypothetical protein
MKYKFTHDAEYLKTHIADLSENEMLAVLCTILGGHNAEFYGYQTERIDNAIKLLEEKVQGIIPFNDNREQVFYNSDTRLTKFEEKDYDIVYHCHATEERIDYRVDDLVQRLKNGWKIQRDVYKGKFNCNITDISQPHTSSVAKSSMENYNILFTCNRVLKFLRVATTIADIRGRVLVWSDDINRAVKLYNN